MIHKELLSEVLGFDFIDEKIEYDDYYITYFNTYLSIPQKLNIYELAHKCKEWAYSKGHIVVSGDMSQFDNGDFIHKSYIYKKYKTFRGSVMATFGTHSEHQAIFKACEWILEQKAKV